MSIEWLLLRGSLINIKAIKMSGMATFYEEYKGYACLCYTPGQACTDRFKKELMDVF